MRITVRLLALLMVVAVATSFTGSRASAHEVRMVGDGQYQMVVGFLDEPAFVGEKNGLDLSVSKVGSPAVSPTASPVADDDGAGVPVEGLETTLRAEVIYADQRLALPLDTVYNSPGSYASYFFPTAEGDYSFHITGTIEGVTIDETFTSSPEGFGSVEPRIEFPATAAQVKTTRDTVGHAVVPGVLALAGLGIGGVVYGRRRSVI